jgi:MFS transporter, ACS family, hexuronate transporter
MSAASDSFSNEFTTQIPEQTSIRWFVCGLLFLATTINYMDRSVLSLIEPLLHQPFMHWKDGVAAAYQVDYNYAYGHIVIWFQVAYGVGLLCAGRIIDKLGTKTGYALAILIWALASMSHSLVHSILGFCIARAFLGLGEAGNFPAAIKATTEWFPTNERALATGLFNSGSNASFFIAPILIAAVTSRWGWRSAFICTGSMGLVWLVLWLLFPYNRLRRSATMTQQNLERVVPNTTGWPFYRTLLRTRGLYAFSIGKALTDPIWWFYLFYLPKFLNENYGLDLNHAKYPLIVVYSISSVGSIGGGWLSGMRMKAGHSVNNGRKFAMFVCAVCVLPIMLVPHMHDLSPSSAWPAIALFSLAAAAHQGWSANLFSTPTDMIPSSSVSTVVGIGGACGAAGGACFTLLVSHVFALHPLPIFILAGFAYLIALAIFQLLVPRLGVPAEARPV